VKESTLRNKTSKSENLMMIFNSYGQVLDTTNNQKNI